jgi:hypothetical protein
MPSSSSKSSNEKENFVSQVWFKISNLFWVAVVENDSWFFSMLVDGGTGFSTYAIVFYVGSQTVFFFIKTEV